MQEFIEIEAYLLLTLFICLHNHLSSIHSIVTYLRVHMMSGTENERLLLPSSFTAKLEVAFLLIKENTFP